MTQAATAQSHTLRRTTFLPGALADVFAFFNDPRNLETITPPWLGFRITSTSDETVREGTRIRYRLRLHGIPMNWESRIKEYVDQSHFADEQLSGPYARWYHRHRFRAVAGGGVEMTDEVEYRLPFGPLGRLVHWLVVRHQLRAIFDYRTRVITERFRAVTPLKQEAA
ncbi:MAG: SRPBCC family protein [Gemmatimonadetes bacterium]|nr:SRPBCC family protein [Gemmatimonadota bacterium]